MSKIVENRIVQMEFDNASFERNVKQSMLTLDKLKKTLNFGSSTTALNGLTTATATASTNALTFSNALETIKQKMPLKELIRITAIINLTNKAINTVTKSFKALTIDPILTGFNEYETKMNSIQTIMSNTASKGTTMEDVIQVIDELNTYADKTIYNFAEMTRNIGTFTAAGVGLKDSASAIQGIANMAAASGSSSQQAATAMYQLSQAMAAGTIKLMDWNSIVNAGMGGEKFQNALKQTAREHGIAVDEMIAKEGSFRESLQLGWITADIMNETLKKFTVEGAKDYAAAMVESGKYTQEQADALVKEAQTMEDAATKVKTFTQLWDTLKESVQSTWGKTWELFIGDFEEAKKLFTEISDSVGGFIEKIGNSQNNFFMEGLGSGWKQFLDLGIPKASDLQNILKYEGVLSGVFTDMEDADKYISEFGTFDESLQSGWVSATMLEKAMAKYSTTLAQMSPEMLKQKGYTQEMKDEILNVATAFQAGMYSYEDFSFKMKSLSGRLMVFESLKNILKAIGSVIKALSRGFDAVFKSVSGKELYEAIKQFYEWTKTLQLSDEAADALSATMYGVASILKVIIDVLKGVFAGVKNVAFSMYPILEGILSVIGAIGQFIGKLLDGCNVAEYAAHAFTILERAVSSSAEYIGNALKTISKSIIGSLNPVGTYVNGFTRSFMSNFEGMGDSVDNFKIRINTTFTGMKDTLETCLKPIKSFVSYIWNYLLGLTKGGSWYDVLATILDGFSVVVFVKLAQIVKKLTESVGTIAEEFAKIEKSFTSLVKSMSNTVKAAGFKFKAEGIKSLAISAAIIVGTYIALTLLIAKADIDPETMMVAFAGMIGTLLAFVGLIALLNRVSSNIASAKIGDQIVQFVNFTKLMSQIITTSIAFAIASIGVKNISIAANNFSNAIGILGKMNTEEATKGLLLMTAIMGECALLLFALSTIKVGALAAGPALLGVIGALTIIAIAAEKFTKLNDDVIERTISGVTAIGIVIAGLGLVLRTFNPASSLAASVSLGLICVALLEFRGVMELYKNIDDSCWQSLLALAGMLGILAGATRLVGPTILAIKGLGFALVGFSIASMSLATSVLIMSGAMVALQKFNVGLGAFLGVVGTAATLIIGFALGLSIVSASASTLAPAIPILLGVSGAVLAFGAGIALFSVGLAGLATGVSMAGASLILLARYLAMALVVFTDTLAKGAPIIAQGIADIMIAIVAAIVQNAPKLKVALGNGVNDVVAFLGVCLMTCLLAMTTGLPVFVVGIFSTIIYLCRDQITEIIEENLWAVVPGITAALVLAISAIIGGAKIAVASAMVGVTVAVIAALILFKDDVIENIWLIAPPLIAAVAAISYGLCEGIKRGAILAQAAIIIGFGALGFFIKQKVAEITGNDSLGIFAGVSTFMTALGVFIAAKSIGLSVLISKLILGIKALVAALLAPGGWVILVVAAFVALSAYLATKTDEIEAWLESWLPALGDLIYKGLCAIVDGVKRIIGGIVDFFTGAGEDAADGYAQGLDKGGKRVEAASIGLAHKSKAAFQGRKGIDAHSPSKVFEEFGKYTVDGYVDGIKDNEIRAAKSMENLANTSLESFCDKMGIHSRSTEMYENGEYTVEGQADGMTSPKSKSLLTGAFGTMFDWVGDQVNMFSDEMFGEGQNMISQYTNGMYSNMDELGNAVDNMNRIIMSNKTAAQNQSVVKYWSDTTHLQEKYHISTEKAKGFLAEIANGQSTVDEIAAKIGASAAEFEKDLLMTEEQYNKTISLMGDDLSGSGFGDSFTDLADEEGSKIGSSMAEAQLKSYQVYDAHAYSAFAREAGSKIIPILEEYAKKSTVSVESMNKISKASKLNAKDMKVYIDALKEFNDLSAEEEFVMWSNLVASTVEGTEDKYLAEQGLYSAIQTLEDKHYQHSMDWIAKEKEEKRLSLEEELAAYIRVRDRYKEGSAVYKEMQEQIKRVNQEIIDSSYEISERWIDAQDSLVTKLFGYQRVIARDGLTMSTEKKNEYLGYVKDLQDKILDATEKYYDDKKQIEEDYQKAKADLEAQQEAEEDNFVASQKQRIDDLNKSYEDAIKQRADALYSKFGMFDIAGDLAEIDKQDLIDNLQTQVDAINDWKLDINGLAARGVDEDFIKELQELGIDAAAEIKAMNKMSDEELDNYVNLWQLKHDAVNSQAEYENRGLKAEVDRTILDIEAETESGLIEIGKTYSRELENLNTETDNKLLEVKNTWLKDIGLMKESTTSEVKTMMEGIISVLGDESMWSEGMGHALENMLKDITEGKSNIYDILQNVQNTVLTESANTIDKTLDKVKTGLVTSGMIMGSLIPGSIGLGITSSLYALENACDDMTNLAEDTTRDNLEMHSPSRVFMRIGSFLCKGMAEGIDNELPTVDNSIQNLLASIFDGTGDIDTSLVITPELDLHNIDGFNLNDYLKLNSLVPVNPTLTGVRTSNARLDDLKGTTNVTSTQIVDSILSLKNDISSLASVLRDFNIVLDTGELVGGITSDMDASLGKLAYYNERGM